VSSLAFQRQTDLVLVVGSEMVESKQYSWHADKAITFGRERERFIVGPSTRRVRAFFGKDKAYVSDDQCPFLRSALPDPSLSS